MNNTENLHDKIVVDTSGHPDKILIDGEKYHLLCEYERRSRDSLVSVYVEDEGTNVVIHFPQDRFALMGAFSVAPAALDNLFHYIEATIALNAKDGFDVYCEDLSKLLELAESNGGKYPLIHNGIEPKTTLFSRLFNRIYQERVAEKVYDYIHEALSGSDARYVETAPSNVMLKEDVEDLEIYKSSEREDITPPKISPAASLPYGWRWIEYDDGSGQLESPKGESRFAYDLGPYCMMPGVEYRKDSEDGWSVFFGTFEEFKGFAEKALSREFGCLGKYDIPKIMGNMADNAWYGRTPTTVYLAAGENIVEINGYTYEPSYESFAATSSISLNGEILYGEDSRCVEAYRYEVYQTGRFETLDEAITHISDTVKESDFVLVSAPAQVEELIADASVRSEQSKADDKDKHKDSVDLGVE